MFALCIHLLQPVDGSVRSTVSAREPLRCVHNGHRDRSSPTPSDSPSRRSAAARLVGRTQLTSAVKKMNKRHRTSASFTFLLACGLHVDRALRGASAPLNGRHSLATAGGLAIGRHGNAKAPANGHVDHRTSVPPTSDASRLDQPQQLQQRRGNDNHHFIDIRL